MRILAALFIAMMAGTPLMAHAQASSCGAYTPAAIIVQPVFDEVAYDFTQRFIQIRDISKAINEENGTGEGASEGTTAKHGEPWPIGLSTNEMYFNFTSDIFKTRRDGQTTICGQVAKVTVNFGFKDNKIYVAKEYPKRSCPYREILAHEEKHKAVDRALLEEYAQKMQEEFTQATKDIGVVEGSAPDIVDNKISSKLDQLRRRLSQEMLDQRIKRQKKVDSKEEYQRITDSCDGQTMQVLRDRLDLLEETRPGITKASE